jgi:hypothetical protein
MYVLLEVMLVYSRMNERDMTTRRDYIHLEQL